MLNVYWVLFLCVPDTLAAPCVTCFGFQPGCTFETDGKCPMADIPAANLAITAKAGVGGALILQNGRVVRVSTAPRDIFTHVCDGAFFPPWLSLCASTVAPGVPPSRTP